jgi:hypothetical protein
MDYKVMYEYEKKRADSLKYDLDNVDEHHFDECADLNAEIARLNQIIKRRKEH